MPWRAAASLSRAWRAKPGAHAAGRQKPAQPLADHQILQLEFGKLIAIKAVREFEGGVRRGSTGACTIS